MVVALDRLLGASAVDEVLALVSGDSIPERSAEPHVDRSRVVRKRRERGGCEDDARPAGRFAHDGAPELGQPVAELHLLQRGRGSRTARHRQAACEHPEASAETLLDVLEVLDLEVLRIELACKTGECLPIEERYAR
jgi:hypothetical protein